MTVVQRPRSFERTWDHPEGAANAVLGGYRLLTELATGELCSVSMARSLQSSHDAGIVAIKRLRTPHQNSAGRSRLLREARVLLSLRAQNLVRVREIHTQPELFVVMEHVPGASLRSLLTRAREVDALRYIVPIFVDALRGLSALHNWKDEQGAPSFLVHQAPTARHMLVGLDGVTRLIDLSHVHGRQLGDGEGVFRGQRTEAAPEQLSGRAALDPRCDIFIVGTALLEALACARDARAAMLSESHVRARLGTLMAIGQRARASDRSARFWSADEMAYALQKAADEADLYADRAAVGAYVQRVLALESPPEAARASRTPSAPPPLPAFLAAPPPRACVPPPPPAAAVQAPAPRRASAPAVAPARKEPRTRRRWGVETLVFVPSAKPDAPVSASPEAVAFVPRKAPAARVPASPEAVAFVPRNEPVARVSTSARAPAFVPSDVPAATVSPSAPTATAATAVEHEAAPSPVTVPRASRLSAYATPTGLRGSAHDATALRLPTTTRTRLGLMLGSGAVISLLLLVALRAPQPASTPTPPVDVLPAVSREHPPAQSQSPQAEPPLHPVVTAIVRPPSPRPARSALARAVISVPQPRAAAIKPDGRIEPPAPARARVEGRDKETRELPVVDLYEDGLRSLSPRLPSNPYE